MISKDKAQEEWNKFVKQKPWDSSKIDKDGLQALKSAYIGTIELRLTEMTFKHGPVIKEYNEWVRVTEKAFKENYKKDAPTADVAWAAELEKWRKESNGKAASANNGIDGKKFSIQSAIAQVKALNEVENQEKGKISRKGAKVYDEKLAPLFKDSLYANLGYWDRTQFWIGLKLPKATQLINRGRDIFCDIYTKNGGEDIHKIIDEFKAAAENDQSPFKQANPDKPDPDENDYLQTWAVWKKKAWDNTFVAIKKQIPKEIPKARAQYYDYMNYDAFDTYDNAHIGHDNNYYGLADGSYSGGHGYYTQGRYKELGHARDGTHKYYNNVGGVNHGGDAGNEMLLVAITMIFILLCMICACISGLGGVVLGIGVAAKLNRKKKNDITADDDNDSDRNQV